MHRGASELLASFARTTDSVVTLDELRRKLSLGRPLRIKYGVDVTAPLLHIGHAVNLWMMRELQEQGHVVVFLVGDFTTRVGDPTGKSRTRPIIPRDEIEANAAGFLEQVSGILRTGDDVLEVRRNSEWYDPMRVDELLSLLAMVTHGRLVSRDMFQRRIEAGDEIHMHELLYPVLQGYDSYMLESDLTIVGTDQLFNEMMGRFYQERLGQEPQVVLTTKITPGIDGREKQSKSLGNYISIAHPPREIFGRAMSIPDELIVPYLRVYTEVPDVEVDELEAALEKGAGNPMEAKKGLARALVARYHGAQAAEAEQGWFEETFSGRHTPTDAPEVAVERGTDALGVLIAAMPDESRSQLRRLLGSGAVTFEGAKLADDWRVADDGVLKVGKRRWFKIHATRAEGSVEGSA